MTYPKVVPLQVPLRWGLEDLRLREGKASVENVVSENVVSTKAVLLERKKDSVEEVVLHMAVPWCL